VLTGFLIGFATLTKIYPILLLAVVLVSERGSNDRGMALLRKIMRHNAPLLITCVATILLGYLPYLILGHGQAFGYFATYASEQGRNAGVTQQIVHWLGDQLHLPIMKTITLEHIVDFLLVGVVSLVVFVLRVRNRLSMEAAVLLLFGVVLSISSHVFPWYTTTLLLWVPVLVGPLWTRTGTGGRSLAIIAVWYFTTTSLLGYFFNSGPSNPLPDWTPYYRLVYTPVMIALGVAAIIGVVNRFRCQKGIALASGSTNNAR